MEYKSLKEWLKFFSQIESKLKYLYQYFQSKLVYRVDPEMATMNLTKNLK